MAIEDHKQIILVCETKNEVCDDEPYEVSVGGKTHLFCCEKGFVQSLEDFTTTIK